MDKLLGQEYEGKARASFLRDNCDAVEDLGYTKALPNDEGVLVYARPARPDELQKNIFRMSRTGTEG